MTGPEHYRKAEELLAALDQFESGSSLEVGTLAEAQVHATLASAAATVGTSDYAAWLAVAGKPKETGQ